MPDALNYRAGPHPGCPFKCLDVPIHRVGPQPRGPLYVPDSLNNREEPQVRERSKCLISTTRKKTKRRKHMEIK